MNHAPLPISVCLIVKNEAPRLEKVWPRLSGALRRSSPTTAVRRTPPCRFSKSTGPRSFPAPGWVSPPRRCAVWSQARENWLLWLDADEFFSSETLDALARIFQEQPQGPAFPASFRVRRQVLRSSTARKSGTATGTANWVLRIFRRDNFQMSDRRVHESVSVDGPVVRLPGMVEHDSIRDWADRQARSRRYAELWAQQALEDNHRNCLPFPRALWTFCRGYLIRSGWLDGILGFRIAMLNAREVYTKYRLLAELKGQKPAATGAASRT